MHSVREDDLMNSYLMRNFQIKILLSIDRPLQVLHSEETHALPGKDMCQHASAVLQVQIKACGRAGEMSSGRIEEGWADLYSHGYHQGIHSIWDVAGAQ